MLFTQVIHGQGDSLSLPFWHLVEPPSGTSAPFGLTFDLIFGHFSSIAFAVDQCVQNCEHLDQSNAVDSALASTAYANPAFHST